MDTKKIGSYGTYGLHIMENPAGTFSFVGTIPMALCIEIKKPNQLPYMGTPVFKTMEDAENYFESKKHLI